MSHKPQRSAAQKHSTSSDVFQGFRKTPGGFTGQAKSGRTWGDSEKRPQGSGGRTDGRKGGSR